MEVCTITDENEPTLEEETHNANAAAAPLVEKKADKSLHFDDSYSLGPSPIKACFPSHQVRINAYMYHYVRESHRDSSGSVVYGNSITPETARAHYEHLSSLQSQNKIHLAFGSEIEEWEKADCFPHSNIVMLTFDDGRWDNYHYLLPLAREFNIKANL